jgi:hypothetical protein
VIGEYSFKISSVSMLLILYLSSYFRLPHPKIYYISYMMYLHVGFAAGIITTVVVSLATGCQNLDELEPGVVHWLGLRIFYPKRIGLIQASKLASSKSSGNRIETRRNSSELTIVNRAELQPDGIPSVNSFECVRSPPDGDAGSTDGGGGDRGHVNEGALDVISEEEKSGQPPRFSF